MDLKAAIQALKEADVKSIILEGGNAHVPTSAVDIGNLESIIVTAAANPTPQEEPTDVPVPIDPSTDGD